MTSSAAPRESLLVSDYQVYVPIRGRIRGCNAGHTSITVIGTYWSYCGIR